MSKNNAKEILANIEKMLEYYETHTHSWERLRIDQVYDRLSIFDWWNKYLSKSQLLDMKKFVKEAIKLGYEGYVCFKVGATGCSNGMWAHKEESTTGYSPDGKAIFKSFTPSYNYWSFTDGKDWYPDTYGDAFDSLKTIKQFEKAHNDFYNK